MIFQDISLGVAFVAGLVSFLSPCVLALVPAYISYLSGRSIQSTGVVVRNRWETLLHGVAFVLGFSFVFVILGVAASALGAIMYDFRIWFMRIGGGLIIIFGLFSLGVINIPFLNYDTRKQYQPDPRLGYLSSALMGIFFSAGWSPCVGPVLGAILTLAFTGANISQGVFLLIAYSSGLGVPFLLAALGVGRAAELLRQHHKAVSITARITGVLLIIMGILLTTGSLDSLARFGSLIDFGL